MTPFGKVPLLKMVNKLYGANMHTTALVLDITCCFRQGFLVSLLYGRLIRPSVPSGGETILSNLPTAVCSDNYFSAYSLKLSFPSTLPQTTTELLLNLHASVY